MPIPVANLYFLLCYAWDEFAPLAVGRIAAEECSDTLHLFVRLLSTGIRTLHRRGLESGYVNAENAIALVRGRILMTETIRNLPKSPRNVTCSFDEMTTDVLVNRILKATVTAILGENTLLPASRAELRNVLRLLENVQDLKLDTGAFNQVKLYRNNRLCTFLLNVCRLFHDSLQPQDKPGQYRFSEVAREPWRMRRIFEKFIRNFLSRKFGSRLVSRDRMQWAATAMAGSDLGLLPKMETDVTLRFPHRTVIVECKYTDALYDNRFLADKLHSPHLYQLATYLKNLEYRSPPDSQAEGILLYPTTGVTVNQCYMLLGHRVAVNTLDLAQPWPVIERQILEIVGHN